MATLIDGRLGSTWGVATLAAAAVTLATASAFRQYARSAEPVEREMVGWLHVCSSAPRYEQQPLWEAFDANEPAYVRCLGGSGTVRLVIVPGPDGRAPWVVVENHSFYYEHDASVARCLAEVTCDRRYDLSETLRGWNRDPRQVSGVGFGRFVDGR